MKPYELIFLYKKIAVIGMSPKEHRPSHYVSLYLREEGYSIIPVNPNCNEIAGERCYASLLDIPSIVETILVFRRSVHALSITKQAIQIQAKAIWMQDGVYSSPAAKLAQENGLVVVMDDCMLRRHKTMHK